MGRNRVETPKSTFSRREAEVFALMGKGLSTRNISKDLGLSHKSVEVYVNRMKVKLGIMGMGKLRDLAKTVSGLW